MNAKIKHKLIMREWYKTHSNYYKRYTQEHTQQHNLTTQNWLKKHPNYMKKYRKKYLQSERGKQAFKKHNAKRKRELGWILLCPNPFDDSVLVDYHHILGAYVVAIPRDLHKLYGGKHHKENLEQIIKQIYLEN